MTPLLTDRYRNRLAGVLSCYDRIVITGTLPGACFAEGMTKIYGLVDLMDAALASAPLLDAPMLVTYGAKDEIVPKASVRRFVDALPPEPQRRCRLAWYDDGYHMLLRDLEGPVVAADVASWALAPRAALPSGADRKAEEAFSTSASQASVGR